MMPKHAFSAKQIEHFNMHSLFYILLIYFQLYAGFVICWLSIYALVTHTKKPAQTNDYFDEIFGCKQKSHLKLFVIH